MDAVDPLAIIGTTLVDASGKNASRIISLIGSGSFAHVYLAEDALHPMSQSNPNSHPPSLHSSLESPPSTPTHDAAALVNGMNGVSRPGSPSTNSSASSQPQKRAVKRLFKKGLDARQLMLQRQEAAVMKALESHTNIVGLIATVEDEDCLYLVMEYCELDLYEAITQQGGFPEDVVKEVFGQIADAVLFCHSKGYYHRDLKPENCLISTADYKIKLADFGLATTDNWSTEMGCGSVRYMAPECFEAGHNNTDPSIIHYGVPGPDGQLMVGYGPAANDVWALGVILLNLLFGKNPWFEAFPTDSIFAAFSGSNPGILRQQFDLSPHFDSVLRRAFDLDPRRRCSVADLKVMVDSLPRFVGGGIPMPPPVVPNLAQVINSCVGPPGCYGLVLQAGVPIPENYPNHVSSRRQKNRGTAPLSPSATTPNSSNNNRLSILSWDRPSTDASTVDEDGPSVFHTRSEDSERVREQRKRQRRRISGLSQSAVDLEEDEFVERLVVDEVDVIDDADVEEDDSYQYAESMRDRMRARHADRMLAEDETGSVESGSRTETGTVIYRDDAVSAVGVYRFDAAPHSGSLESELVPLRGASSRASSNSRLNSSRNRRLSSSSVVRKVPSSNASTSAKRLSAVPSDSLSNTKAQIAPRRLSSPSAAASPVTSPNSRTTAARYQQQRASSPKIAGSVADGSNASAGSAAALQTPPVSPPPTPGKSQVNGNQQVAAATKSSSSSSGPRTRDSGYDSGERRAAAAGRNANGASSASGSVGVGAISSGASTSPLFNRRGGHSRLRESEVAPSPSSSSNENDSRQLVKLSEENPEDLLLPSEGDNANIKTSNEKSGAIKVGRGDSVEAHVNKILRRLSAHDEEAKQKLISRPPSPALPSRRSPSPRQWFAPLMARESVVAGGVPKTSRATLGLSRFTIRRQNSSNGGAHQGGSLKKKRSARWIGRSEQVEIPAAPASPTPTPAASALNFFASFGNSISGSSSDQKTKEPGSGTPVPAAGRASPSRNSTSRYKTSFDAFSFSSSHNGAVTDDGVDENLASSPQFGSFGRRPRKKSSAMSLTAIVRSVKDIGASWSSRRGSFESNHTANAPANSRNSINEAGSDDSPPKDSVVPSFQLPFFRNRDDSKDGGSAAPSRTSFGSGGSASVGAVGGWSQHFSLRRRTAKSQTSLRAVAAPSPDLGRNGNDGDSSDTLNSSDVDENTIANGVQQVPSVTDGEPVSPAVKSEVSMDSNTSSTGSFRRRPTSAPPIGLTKGVGREGALGAWNKKLVWGNKKQ